MNLQEVIQKYGFKQTATNKDNYYKVVGYNEYHILLSNDGFCFLVWDEDVEDLELYFLRDRVDKLIKFLDLLED